LIACLHKLEPLKTLSKCNIVEVEKEKKTRKTAKEEKQDSTRRIKKLFTRTFTQNCFKKAT
jgi:hypothetical protein